MNAANSHPGSQKIANSAARREELPFATTQKLRASVIDVASNELDRTISSVYVKNFLESEGHPFLDVYDFMRTMTDRKIFSYDKLKKSYTLLMAKDQACKLAFIKSLRSPRKKPDNLQQCELPLSVRKPRPSMGRSFDMGDSDPVQKSPEETTIQLLKIELDSTANQLRASRQQEQELRDELARMENDMADRDRPYTSKESDVTPQRVRDLERELKTSQMVYHSRLNGIRFQSAVTIMLVIYIAAITTLTVIR